MWIKTRVGLVSITEPTEILVHQYPRDGAWSIYARLRSGSERSIRGFFRAHKRTVANPTSQLAAFSDRPGVSEAIGECMAKIEAAIKTGTGFCDLSQAGDAEAWRKAWQQIHWPKQTA